MQPREKILIKGAEALTNAELIALLVSAGYKGRSYKQIANSISRYFAKVKSLEKVDLADLRSIDGVGEVLALKLLASLELGYRLYYRDRKIESIQNTESLIGLLSDIKAKPKEYLKAFFLNARLEIIDWEIVAVGAIDRISIYPKEILTKAVQLNASGIILAHNHPSGMLEPSEEDLQFTKRFREMCKLLDTRLLDHVIVNSHGNWISILDYL